MAVTQAQPQLSFRCLIACVAVLTPLLLSHLTLDKLLNLCQPPYLRLLNGGIKRTCNFQVVRTPCFHMK